MRELLFRGKRKDNGEWVQGHNFFETQNKENVFITPTGLPVPMLGDGSSVVIMMHPSTEVWIDTVGQFTGMTDKNGSKLFEGDLVEVEYEDIYEGVYLCRWDEGNFEFGLTDKTESFGIAYISPDDIAIVGNIYDNPELLEA